MLHHIETGSHRPREPMTGNIRRISPHPGWKAMATVEQQRATLDGHLAGVEYQRIGY